MRCTCSHSSTWRCISLMGRALASSPDCCRGCAAPRGQPLEGAPCSPGGSAGASGSGGGGGGGSLSSMQDWMIAGSGGGGGTCGMPAGSGPSGFSLWGALSLASWCNSGLAGLACGSNEGSCSPLLTTFAQWRQRKIAHALHLHTLVSFGKMPRQPLQPSLSRIRASRWSLVSPSGTLGNCLSLLREWEFPHSGQGPGMTCTRLAWTGLTRRPGGRAGRGGGGSPC